MKESRQQTHEFVAKEDVDVRQQTRELVFESSAEERRRQVHSKQTIMSCCKLTYLQHCIWTYRHRKTLIHKAPQTVTSNFTAKYVNKLHKNAHTKQCTTINMLECLEQWQPQFSFYWPQCLEHPTATILILLASVSRTPDNHNTHSIGLSVFSTDTHNSHSTAIWKYHQLLKAFSTLITFMTNPHVLSSEYLPVWPKFGLLWNLSVIFSILQNYQNDLESHFKVISDYVG